MLDGWASWARVARWVIVGIAGAVLTLVVLWLLLVPVADWLAHHDVGSVKGSVHETAVNNARGQLLTLSAGLFAVGALVFTARNFLLAQRSFELSQQGQVTDRYAKSIEQLGSEKLDIRIGGIYALERVASDSARDHPVVMEVLTAFIREHSHGQWPPPDYPLSPRQERPSRPDIQAALTVLGRRVSERDVRPLDFNNADLTGSNLHDANLANATFIGARLTGARFTRQIPGPMAIFSTSHSNVSLSGFNAILSRANFLNAILTGADLGATDLSEAGFADADLTDAHLSDSNLSYANPMGADLTRADLRGAILRYADLIGAKLSQADLGGADLSQARLTRATLIGADFSNAKVEEADFTGADLSGAKWTVLAPAPEGWTSGGIWGGFVLTRTDSEPPDRS